MINLRLISHLICVRLGLDPEAFNEEVAKSQQGIYLYGSKLIYLAWEPVDELYYFRILKVGTDIRGYSHMKKVVYGIESLQPVQLSWLPNDAIPSDLFPELFI